MLTERNSYDFTMLESFDPIFSNLSPIIDGSYKHLLNDMRPLPKTENGLHINAICSEWSVRKIRVFAWCTYHTNLFLFEAARSMFCVCKTISDQDYAESKIIFS